MPDTATPAVVIIGGPAAGIAVDASRKGGKPDLDGASKDPARVHQSQPGLTMVGSATFDAEPSVKTLGSLITSGVGGIKAAVAGFKLPNNAVILDGCRGVKSGQQAVTTELTLNWAGIEGPRETLGRNGAPPNSQDDPAPCAWQPFKGLKSGRAVCARPSMTPKCSGSPQKAMCLSGDYWHRSGRLNGIQSDFLNADAVLFGLGEDVPALMSFLQKHMAHLLVDLSATNDADVVRTDYVFCPQTVARGKIVLAEFGCSGKSLSSFPIWLIDGIKPSPLAGLLKTHILPTVLWQAMLRGREWMARPQPVTAA